MRLLGVVSLTFRELSEIISRKIYNARNNIYAEKFKLKLCTCAQSMALGTRTKLQLEILIRSTILVIYKFWKNILESLRNVSETPPWLPTKHHDSWCYFYNFILVVTHWSWFIIKTFKFVDNSAINFADHMYYCHDCIHRIYANRMNWTRQFRILHFAIWHLEFLLLNVYT